MMIDLTSRKVFVLILKVMFFVVSTSFVIKFFSHPEHWANAEVSLLFTLEMLTISFPASVLVLIITWLLGLFLSAFSFWQYFELIFFFVSVVLVGYWQWFILLPKLLTRLSGR